MKSLFKFALLTFALSLTAVPSARALDRDIKHHDRDRGDNLAPEVDPTLAVTAFALLAGGLAAAGARRSKA